MTLEQYIQANPAGTAAEFNALPTRYASQKVSFVDLGEALTLLLGDPAAAIAIGNRLVGDVVATGETNPALAAIFTGFANGSTLIDFSKPMVRSQLMALVASPGPLTIEDAQALLALLKDTHGGDKTDADVTAVIAKITREAEIQPWINAASAAQAVAVTEATDPDATVESVRAAMLAAFDGAI